jgi:hypothetical protein
MAKAKDLIVRAGEALGKSLSATFFLDSLADEDWPPPPPRRSSSTRPGEKPAGKRTK